MELGLYTFGELTADATGRTISPEERIRNLVEEMELADQVGLDVFAVGEHHRPDFTVSAPAVVLAAGAARTKSIRLSSAVSVLSSDDPIRVFQQFSTVDLLSGGRAEIMAGRGSFIESFPLFGYDLADYDRLFEEKLRRLLEVRAGSRRQRRVPASRAAAAPGMGRGRRGARIRGAGRQARVADGDRDHRRAPGSVRRVRGASPRGRAARGLRPGLDPDQHQLARLHRRDLTGRRRRRVAALRVSDDEDRS